MSYLTSTTLITSIERRAQLPENQVTFTDQDFLDIANEEIDNSLVPYILSMQEEYFVYPETITLVANTSSYAIPYRAVGGKLRDLFYQDTNGNLIEMSRISPEDKVDYQYEANGIYKYFYIQGNNIVLAPSVGASVVGSLVVTYYLRPNDLVPADEVATITSISTSGSNTIYTIDALPDAFSSSQQFDINQTKSGHKIRVFDLSAVSMSTTNMTFLTANLSSDIVVGDHIGLAGQCFVPQIPSDLHPMLAQRTAQACLEAMGDQAGLQAATVKADKMEQKAIQLIDNRVEGAPLKISNNKGLLRRSRLRRW